MKPQMTNVEPLGVNSEGYKSLTSPVLIPLKTLNEARALKINEMMSAKVEL
jgi:hypothetical protein